MEGGDVAGIPLPVEKLEEGSAQEGTAAGCVGVATSQGESVEHAKAASPIGDMSGILEDGYPHDASPDGEDNAHSNVIGESALGVTRGVGEFSTRGCGTTDVPASFGRRPLSSRMNASFSSPSEHANSGIPGCQVTTQHSTSMQNIKQSSLFALQTNLLSIHHEERVDMLLLLFNLQLCLFLLRVLLLLFILQLCLFLWRVLLLLFMLHGCSMKNLIKLPLHGQEFLRGLFRCVLQAEHEERCACLSRIFFGHLENSHATQLNESFRTRSAQCCLAAKLTDTPNASLQALVL